MRKIRFSQFAWGVLLYNLAVILWGALVRATVSGDGCGQHWPTCGGSLVPHAHRAATYIELAHRVSSGLVIPLTLALLLWSRRRYPYGHPVRLGALLAFCFTWSEAFLGAGLVLFKLVAHNASLYRAVAMSAHLVNTFLLLTALTLTAWWSTNNRPLRLRGQGIVGFALAVGLAATLLLAVSGAITALGDTLYPAHSLSEALRQDLSPASHLLIRLRIFHPMIAVTVGVYSVFLAFWVSRLRPGAQTRRYAIGIALLFVIQLAAGLLNVVILAPVWMQLVHLLLSDLLWINLVLLTASALATPARVHEERDAYSAAPQPVRG